MSITKKYTVKSILLGVIWMLIGVGTIILLVAAVNKNETAYCKGINISISGVSNHYFIDKKEVTSLIAQFEGAGYATKRINRFNLQRIEQRLKTELWIKQAELFFDNNRILQVLIQER